MAEPDGSGISARLWRLPGQLLLALINATAILAIVAAIVTLVAIARINHFAENKQLTWSKIGEEASRAFPPRERFAEHRKNCTVR